MVVNSVDEIVAALRDGRLLRPEQAARLLDEIAPNHQEPAALIKTLIKLGWLTLYQGRKVLGGHSGDLVLGQYLLLDKLGEGGMGKVYKALHTRLERLVALKVIRPDLLGNELAVKRFRREAESAARLDHPNVVRLFDADQIGQRLYLEMEYVEGTDLAKLVKSSGPLSVERACDCVRQAALGLQHAHDKGLVHRDIKPSNLLVGSDRRAAVKILDMGLARTPMSVDADEATALTRDGVVIGTPDFMAPEQAKNSSQAGPSADLYSLGCTLFFVLTGQGPFPKGTILEKLIQHQTDQPPSIRSLRPDVPVEVAALIDSLLAKAPAQRPRSAAAVAAALERWCGGGLVDDIPTALPVPPPPPQAPRPAGAAGSTIGLGLVSGDSTFDFDTAPTARHRPAPRPPEPDRLPRGRLYLAAAVVAVLAVVLSAALWPPSRPVPATTPEGEPRAGTTRPAPKASPKVDPKPAVREMEPVERYLPDDTTAVAVLDVRQFTGTAFFKQQVRPAWAEQFDVIQQTFSFDPTHDVERVTFSTAARGGATWSLLVEGHHFLTSPLLSWVDETEGFAKESIPVAGGDAQEIYVLSGPKVSGGTVYAAILSISPAAVFISGDRQRVADALAKAAGRMRTEIKDRTVAAALPRPGTPAAALTFAAGTAAKWGDRTLEADRVRGLSGRLKCSDGIEIDLTVEAPDAPAAEHFFSSRRTGLVLLALLDKRLTPVAEMFADAGPPTVTKGRTTQARYRLQMPADKLQAWYEQIAKQSEAKPRD